MGNTAFIQTNFCSGEVSPQIEGRVDLVKYGNSAATLNNVFVRVFGGAYRRPGTYFASVTKLSTSAVRLIPFQFSNTQAYIIEAGDYYFRFYKDSGILQTTSGVAVEITTPYAAVNLFELEFAQDADTMYITHTGHPVKKLTRSSHYLWSLAEVDFTGGPWYPDNLDSNAFIKVSSTSGNVVVYTSASATFLAGHSGSLLRVGTSNGYVRLKTITGTSASATVVTTLQSASATGFTTDWAYGAWNKAYGWPQAVQFFEQGLYFGGTKSQPQTVWGSAKQSYEDFTPGTDDDDAVSFTIADNQVNAIRWFAAGTSLAIGTLGGNFIMDSDTSSGPITPTNINIKKETTYGSDLIMPKRIGSGVVYVQRNNLTIRELAYNFEEDAQLATDMTILSDHITKSGIKDMDYQEAPDGILWCVRKDGKMATLTRLADQEVMAWSLHETLGSFLSVAVIPCGNEDQVWVATQRSTIYSATTTNGYIRLVEYFKPFIQPDAQADSFYVDCGLSYLGTGTYAKTVSGADHLNSQTVSVLGDGAVYPDQLVSGGSITLSRSCNIIHLGLPYTSIIKTSRMEAGSIPTSTTQGVIKRIYKCMVRLFRSLGCQVGNETTQDIVYFRDSSMPMDEPPTLFTGDKEVSFPVGWNKKAQVYITQSQPLPLNVLAIVSKVEISQE